MGALVILSLVKQKPGMGCATSGVGSNQHVLLEWFAKQAGIKLDHLCPFAGAGQAINDLVAGHVQVGFLGPTALIPHYKAGTLRLLAQSGDTRSRSLPDVPTLRESGFPDLVLKSWYAAFVPLGTPPAVIARLNAATNEGSANTRTREQADRSLGLQWGCAEKSYQRCAQGFRKVREAHQ